MLLIFIHLEIISSHHGTISNRTDGRRRGRAVGGRRRLSSGSKKSNHHSVCSDVSSELPTLIAINTNNGSKHNLFQLKGASSNIVEGN